MEAIETLLLFQSLPYGPSCQSVFLYTCAIIQQAALNVKYFFLSPKIFYTKLLRPRFLENRSGNRAPLPFGYSLRPPR